MNAAKSQSWKTGSKANLSETLDRRDLDKIRLVVGVSGDQTRSVLCNILKAMGFSRITAFNSLAQVRARIADNLADLVVCAVDIEGGDIQSVIRDVRRQKIGKNPFLFTVYIVNSSGSEFVRSCVDSGVDDLILGPISAASMSNRIAALARNRKPFVVARDYIGPDRRRAERMEEANISELEAPNIFSYVKNGSRGKGFYSDNVKKGAAILKDRWAERQAIQVAYLVEKGIPVLAQRPSQADEITKTFIDDFIVATRTAEDSIVGTRYASEDIVLHTLATVMVRACAAEIPEAEDMATLGKLTQLVRKTFAGETPVQPGETQPSADQPGEPATAIAAPPAAGT